MQTTRTDARLAANVPKFYLYRFLVNLQLWSPIWIIYLQRERGLTLTQVAALESPYLLLMVLAEVPTGAFADRFGRRTSLMLGSVIFGVALFVFGVARSYPIILVSYALWAIGGAFRSGADMAFLYDTLRTLGRADEYARIAGRSFGIFAGASVVATLAGPPLAARTALHVPVIVSAAITTLSCLAAASFREPSHESGGRRTGVIETMRRGASAAWREPRLRYMLGLTAVLRTVGVAPTLLVQPFLTHYDVPVAAFGLLQLPGRVCAIIAALYAYLLLCRWGERGAIMLLPATLLASYLLIAAWHSPFALGGFYLAALVLSGASPLLSAYVNRHTPSEQRATVLSFGQLAGSVLLIGLEPAVGALAQVAGLTVAFLTASLLLAAGSAATILPWLASETRAREAGTATPVAGVD